MPVAPLSSSVPPPLIGEWRIARRHDREVRCGRAVTVTFDGWVVIEGGAAPDVAVRIAAALVTDPASWSRRR